MSQFQENCITDARTDGRPHRRTDAREFIGPFRLKPGVQKVNHGHPIRYYIFRVEIKLSVIGVVSWSVSFLGQI